MTMGRAQIRNQQAQESDAGKQGPSFGNDSR